MGKHPCIISKDIMERYVTVTVLHNFFFVYFHKTYQNEMIGNIIGSFIRDRDDQYNVYSGLSLQIVRVNTVS